MITDGIVTYQTPPAEYRRAHGIAVQIAITGDDWTSERDKNRQRRADAALKKASLAAARDMRKAAESLRAQYRSYIDAGHEDKMGRADGRLTQASELDELAGFFESVYEATS